MLVMLSQELQAKVLRLKAGLSCLSRQEGLWYHRLLLTLFVCGPSQQLASASKLPVLLTVRLFSLPRFEQGLEVSSVTGQIKRINQGIHGNDMGAYLVSRLLVVPFPTVLSSSPSPSVGRRLSSTAFPIS